MAPCSVLDALLTSLLWTLLLRTAEGMRPRDEADNETIFDGVDEGISDVIAENSTWREFEFPPDKYVGLEVLDSWCGPIVGRVHPKGYAARLNITSGAFIWEIDGTPVYNIRKQFVKILWLQVKLTAEETLMPYKVKFDFAECGFQYDAESIVYVFLIVPGILGLLLLLVGYPCLLLSGLAALLCTKNSAAMGEEQSNWQPLRIIRLAVPIDHPAIYCPLLLGAVGEYVIHVQAYYEILWFPTVLLDHAGYTAKYFLLASVAVVFATRPANGWPLEECNALQAAARCSWRHWALVTCLLSLPFCLEWQRQQVLAIADIIWKYHSNVVVHTWQLGDVLEHGACFLAFCGIFRFSAEDVLFPALTAKARVQRLRVSILGEWRGHLDQVHAEIVALTTETLPGLRARTDRCFVIFLLALVWMTCLLFRMYSLPHNFHSKGWALCGWFTGKVKYGALLMPSLVAMVATVSVSDDCVYHLMEDLNQLRLSCSVEDHEKLLIIEKFVKKSSRNQGIGAKICGVVVTSRLLASLTLQASVLIGGVVYISGMISDSAIAIENGLYNITK